MGTGSCSTHQWVLYGFEYISGALIVSLALLEGSHLVIHAFAHGMDSRYTVWTDVMYVTVAWQHSTQPIHLSSIFKGFLSNTSEDPSHYKVARSINFVDNALHWMDPTGYLNSHCRMACERLIMNSADIHLVEYPELQFTTIHAPKHGRILSRTIHYGRTHRKSYQVLEVTIPCHWMAWLWRNPKGCQ